MNRKETYIHTHGRNINTHTHTRTQTHTDTHTQTYHLIPNPLHRSDIVKLPRNERLQLGELLRVDIHHETMHGQDFVVDVCVCVCVNVLAKV